MWVLVFCFVFFIKKCFCFRKPQFFTKQNSGCFPSWVKTSSAQHLQYYTCLVFVPKWKWLFFFFLLLKHIHAEGLNAQGQFFFLFLSLPELSQHEIIQFILQRVRCLGTREAWCFCHQNCNWDPSKYCKKLFFHWLLDCLIFFLLCLPSSFLL